MIRPSDTPRTGEKSRAMKWLESVLLCVLLGFIVLRTTVIETPLIDQPQTRLFISAEIVSLLLSTVLLICIGLWFLVSVLSNQFRWRKTGFGCAVGLFVAAGVLSACFASDKRAAVTDLVTLAVPMLAGLLLVQVLTSQVKIRLALFLILAVGAAMTVQCLDQQTSSNKTLIAEYEANPAEFLQKQGIEPDTMEHWMYEHRLYSKDIRGFLLTSNSAASFFLLAVFAGLGLCLQAIDKKMSQESIAALVCYLMAMAIILFGLALTQSKGGIGAFGAGVLMLLVLIFFGKTVWKHWRIAGILLLLALVVGAGLVIGHGIHHGRLPGGNSMLVRWQYWVSAAAMIRDHIFTGVGGGNFPDFYVHYKIPAASETVQNPHNWILSLLSQYGPLGLLAFLAAVLWPLYKVCGDLWTADRPDDSHALPDDNRIWIGVLATAAIVMLFIRPVLVDAEFLYQKVDVRAAAYLVLYLVPAAVVVLSFILLRAASAGDASGAANGARLQMALICGLIAVLIHNLIDFAIFEPGNWSVFWLFIAILAAHTHNTAGRSEEVFVLDLPKRTGAVAGLILMGVVYLAVVLLPPVRALRYLRQSMGDDIQRVALIEKAIAADPLSSQSAYKAAGMFSQAYQQRRLIKEIRFLDKAVEWARIAADRNPADFKPPRLLGRAYVLLAEQAEDKQKEGFLQTAFDNYEQAVRRYPGSDQLHFELAQIAEKLNRFDIALCHYQTAVDIEDAYRAQFKIMYPDRKTVISRLGNADYDQAKARVEKLQKNPQ